MREGGGGAKKGINNDRSRRIGKTGNTHASEDTVGDNFRIQAEASKQI